MAAGMQPDSTRNLIDDIYQDLRGKILTGMLPSGRKISEITLASDYRCSRTPVRESLKRLEGDGLVVIKPKSGTYVENETSRDFAELMQVRAALERLAFTLAVDCAGENDIRYLERLLQEMDRLIAEDPVDMMEFARVHYEFHLSMVKMSGNSLLLRQFERLNLRSSHMFYQIMEKNPAVSTQDEHRRIVASLKETDPAGADFVQAHLNRKIRRHLDGRK